MRYITMPETTAEDIIAKLNEKLRSMFAESRNIQAFTYSFKPEDFIGKAEVVVDFSAMAFLKQHMLVASHKDEIAWHGIVRASEDRKFYHIEDILVYPQAVTGATVTTDEIPYQAWKNKLSDDQYNNLRYQAHSHVRMATNPSGVDTTLYDAMLSALGPTSYYIFLIMNKNSEFWITIYDMQNNVIYDKTDITITIDGIVMDKWYEETINTYIKTYTWQQQNAARTGVVAPGFQVPAATNNTGTEDEKKTVTPTNAITNRSGYRDITNIAGRSTGKFTYSAPYELKGMTKEDQALLQRYEQLRKNGAKYPIFCVGCKHAKKFHPNKPPCHTCEVLQEAQLADYAASQK